MKELIAAGGFMALVALTFTVFIYGAIAYVIGSGVASGIKVVKDECHKTYGIEKFVDGKWFCEEKK